ncbi:MAG: hypothetical protein VB055_01950 [Oscillospiraceae bacterium]|nr:hypothetical protein [Oscillospiraceae bacterium]
MMPHIVFVTHGYVPDSDANITCTRNIICGLLQKGYVVSCVCGGSLAEDMKEPFVGGVRVIRVPHTTYEQTVNACRSSFMRAVYQARHIVKGVALLPRFPNTSPKFADALYRVLEDLNTERHIDCIVGVFRPYAPVFAAMKYKKKHTDVKVIGYYLDILKGAVKPPLLPQSMYEYLCDHREKRIFCKLDCILMAENGRRFYDGNSLFNSIKHLHYINFPTLILSDETGDGAPCSEMGKIMLTYAGYMDKQYRNPEIVIIDIIALAECSERPVELHLYGSSNMDDTIDSYVKKYPKTIFYHGRVAKKEADAAVARATAIISIGNDLKGVVPSKIFELFATKKKLLHFSDNRMDETLSYFELYPNACIIDKSQLPADAASVIKNFLELSPKPISNEFLKKSFFSATPDLTISYIEKECTHGTGC